MRESVNQPESKDSTRETLEKIGRGAAALIVFGELMQLAVTA